MTKGFSSSANIFDQRVEIDSEARRALNFIEIGMIKKNNMS